MKYEMIGDPESRTWMLVFESGDRVLDSMLAFADEAAVLACAVSGIGAFSECTIAFFDRGSRSYHEIPVPEQAEVLSLLGNITRGPQGDYRLHVHATLGRRDGSTLGGHFIDGIVWPTLEVFVSETSASVGRRVDEDSGLPLCALE